MRKFLLNRHLRVLEDTFSIGMGLWSSGIQRHYPGGLEKTQAQHRSPNGFLGTGWTGVNGKKRRAKKANPPGRFVFISAPGEIQFKLTRYQEMCRR